MGGRAIDGCVRVMGEWQLHNFDIYNFILYDSYILLIQFCNVNNTIIVMNVNMLW